ncbi:hypothetical protein JI749_16865 [Devosia oryziradicis]|uniref:Uncharacterized protein n=1 Tax=Devosia oryziradicis TaxID=2801335 RepID=A0ABX7C1U2_9HYPH|nr:hypothetical protein [Devosia oryziradicis]QQR35981.1 hypothetical protein JI749_16865 [Devosia oryziradicis]
MRTGLIVLSILAGAGGVAAALALKPTGFDECVGIISADIERNASPGATLDPRDVEAEAARVCAGST